MPKSTLKPAIEQAISALYIVEDASQYDPRASEAIRLIQELEKDFVFIE